MKTEHPHTQNQAPSRNARRGAFTLLEIMVVVVIIGILAGMAVMVIDPKGQANEARKETTKARITQVQGQVELYEMKHGKPPANLEALVQSKQLKETPKDAWGDPLSLQGGTVVSKNMSSASTP